MEVIESSASHQKNGSNKWKLRYVQLIRISNWLMIPLYFFVCLVPGYYVMTANLPPPEQLKVSEGRLVLKWMEGKKGYMTGIEKGGQKVFLLVLDGLLADMIAFLMDVTRSNKANVPTLIRVVA